MARGAKSMSAKIATLIKRNNTLPINVNFNLPSTSGNRFNALANLDMDTTTESNINEVKKSKPPPIVVDPSVPFSDMQEILGKEYIYKNTSIGTNIFSPSADKYESCKQTLKEKNFEFHSYNTKENKLYTIFLYGLPYISTDDIINELKNYNLVPSSVMEIKTKFSTINNAVYKVQFNRKTFNPQSLNNVRTICNIIISWKKHKPQKRDKPTQCWNCLMYGHGGEHCNRRAACMICANYHHTNQCPFNNNEKKPAVFSCFNCKKNGRERIDHSANDINCPYRSLYLESRERATSKNRPKNRQNQQNSFNYNMNEFPHLNNHMNQNVNHANNSRTHISYANQLKSDNLFNIDDLFEIFIRATEDLRKCTTKAQQIQVVMSMVKYAYEL